MVISILETIIKPNENISFMPKDYILHKKIVLLYNCFLILFALKYLTRYFNELHFILLEKQQLKGLIFGKKYVIIGIIHNTN